MPELVESAKASRKRARDHIENGAVVSSYQGDRETILRLLNEALATEIICVLRYKRHYEMAQGIHSESVAKEFLQHANEEQKHADWLAGRIAQLNGEPNYNPDGMSARSHTQYIECNTLGEMIRENLIAERIAIESYGSMIRDIGNDDPTTRRLLEDILKDEEEHADELSKMLRAFGSTAAA